MMDKYIFQQGGQQSQSADMFNNYVDNLIQSQQEDENYVQADYQEVEEPEESEYIQGLREYDEEATKESKEEEYELKFKQLESLLDEKLAQIGQQMQEQDWWESDDGNEELASYYNTQSDPNNPPQDDKPTWLNRQPKIQFAPQTSIQPTISNNSPYKLSANILNPDSYLRAIFGNEGGKTGIDPKNVRGTASGKYAIIKSGRKGLYNKYYKDEMDYATFEKKYNSESAFEYDVAKKLALENINSSKTVAEAIGRWYSPAHASTGKWGIIPRPDYGNRLTVGQYVDNAFKNYN